MKKKYILSNVCHILEFAGFGRSFGLSREQARTHIFKKICESVWKYFRTSEKVLKHVARREGKKFLIDRRKKNLYRWGQKKVWQASEKF